MKGSDRFIYDKIMDTANQTSRSRKDHVSVGRKVKKF